MSCRQSWIIVLLLHLVCTILIISLKLCIDSNHYACSTLRQHKFLTSLLNKIETDEGWSSINDDLNKMKAILTNPNNIKLHLAANLDALCELVPDASSILEQLLPADKISSDKK